MADGKMRPFEGRARAISHQLDLLASERIITKMYGAGDIMKNVTPPPTLAASFTSRLTRLAGLMLVIGFTASSTYGATFQFTYRFSDFIVDGEGLVTGSLEGERNGVYVQNVRNVSLCFDGVSINDPIFVGKRTGPGVLVPGTDPVVSFDVAKNDFIFANTDFLHGYGGYSTYFYILPDWNGTVELADRREAVGVVLGSIPLKPAFFAEDAPSPYAANWFLAEVPETGTVASGFIGFGLLILASLLQRNHPPHPASPAGGCRPTAVEF